MKRRLELLAPAKDADYGITAIDYGADAVYIGAPKFGARAAVGNSMNDIRRLVEYAHRFGTKVYLALNTVLYDNELEVARQIALQAWESGVDALIVQDMALAEMDLPIPLHASTQTFNLSPEKARFFESAGFSRMILERAVSLDEIREIRRSSGIELEAFVHGAICVCYSGQCYMSHVISGKSGNRGECMQPCRWDYNLTGENFRRLASAKHLLSVEDLNLSAHLEKLIDSGVCSFKIEGRLKDITYLKNSVAYYRKELDRIISGRNDLMRSSEGETAFDFAADPCKTFSRGFTNYYLVERKNKVSSFDTPKSVGKYIGEVRKTGKDSFVLDQAGELFNGDGICFVSGGKMLGTNVNKAEGDTVWPNRMDGIGPGVNIFRNYDHRFAKSLERSKTRRMIAVTVQVRVEAGRLSFEVTDALGNRGVKTVDGVFEPARNVKKAEETIRQQAAKSGDTIFRVEEVTVCWDTGRFVPASVLNGVRREALDSLDAVRLANYQRDTRAAGDPAAVYPQHALDYRGNVTNRLAEAFYRKHGVSGIEPGVELQSESIGKEVMRTRYCIRREMGDCLREKSCTYTGPLQLENNYTIFELKFDCARCEMALVYKGKRK